MIDWVCADRGRQLCVTRSSCCGEDHASLSRRSGPAGENRHGAEAAPPVAREADDRALMLQVVGFYSETLKQSPEAKGIWKSAA